MVPEKTLESLSDSKETKPVNPKGNQPWIFIRRADAEAEAPIFCLPDAKNWLIGKDPDAGKDRRQEKGNKFVDSSFTFSSPCPFKYFSILKYLGKQIRQDFAL